MLQYRCCILKSKVMKVFIIIVVVFLLLLVSNLDDRLLYVENYLRQILDIMRELESKKDGHENHH